MYMDNSFERIRKFDPEIAELTLEEERRQLSTLCLIASENYASPLTIGMEGTVWANKNAEGYPGGALPAAVNWPIKSSRLPLPGAKRFLAVSMSTFKA